MTADTPRIRTELTGALCVICHQRPDELATALGSAQDLWHEVIVVDMASEPPLAPVSGAKWIRSNENLGPPGGFNLLAEASTSDFLVFLDDDAVLRTHVTTEVSRLFADDERLAVVAFKVVRADDTVRKIEHPFRGKVRDPDRARPCAYYLEGACAIRREAFDDVGGYDASFLYSVEGVDLSFKLARRGWTFTYAPQVVVEHRPSSVGRSFAPRIPGLTARNRIIVARRHLPLPVAMVHAAMWIGFMFTKAVRVRSVRAWWSEVRQGLTVPVQREPIAWRVLWRMHQLRGRVLW